MLIQLNDSDILDEFNKGHWVLLSVGEKSDMISHGNHIQVRERKALVDEMIVGRNDRLALRLTFINEGDKDDVVTSPLLANPKLVVGQHVSRTSIEAGAG